MSPEIDPTPLRPKIIFSNIGFIGFIDGLVWLGYLTHFSEDISSFGLKGVRSILRVNAQARISWNSDFSYIYPIYDTQGTLGNGETNHF